MTVGLFQAEIKFPARLRELFVELLQTGADTLASEYYLSEHQEELLDCVNNYLSEEKRQIRLARKSGDEILPSHLTGEEDIKVTRDSRLGAKIMVAARALEKEIGPGFRVDAYLRRWTAGMRDPETQPERGFVQAVADALSEALAVAGKGAK